MDPDPGLAYRAVSVWQPWASWLACTDLKNWETKPVPTHIRERVAIHATKSAKASVVRELVDRPEYQELVSATTDRVQHFRGLQHGVILGTGVVTDCVPCSEIVGEISEEERLLGFWTEDRWAWRIEDKRPLSVVVACAGQQGWWRLPGVTDEVVRAMEVSPADVLA